jgi:hypothetical protein
LSGRPTCVCTGSPMFGASASLRHRAPGGGLSLRDTPACNTAVYSGSSPFRSPAAFPLSIRLVGEAVSLSWTYIGYWHCTAFTVAAVRYTPCMVQVSWLYSSPTRISQSSREGWYHVVRSSSVVWTVCLWLACSAQWSFCNDQPFLDPFGVTARLSIKEYR